MSRFAEPPSSSDNTLALLMMLSNSEELKTRLEQLRTQEKALDEKIALAGEANEILTLKEQAHALLQEANETMERMRTEGQLYLDNARKEASQVLEQANQVLAQSQAESARQKVELEQYANEFKAILEKERVAHNYDCQEQDQVLNDKRLSLETMRQELKAKEEQLTQAKSQLAEKENALAIKEKNLERYQRDVNAWYNDLKKISESFAKELTRVAR